MTGIEALQSVQFITVNDKRLAVLNAEDWESLVEGLETLEDVNLAKDSRRALQSAGGNRSTAGWLAWDQASKELE